MPASKPTLPPATIETKLDQIILHLERLDKRDKLRTIGGFFRFLLTLIPLLLVLGSGWYFVNHSAEFIKMISDQAAKSAAAYTKNQSSSMFEQLMKQYGTPKE